MIFLRVVPLLMMLLGCGIRESESGTKIIGGFIAPNDKNTIGLYPSTIGILNLGTKVGNCTASRISNEYFLTAGHCIADASIVDGDSVQIYFSNTRSINAKYRRLKVHPSYTSLTSIVTPDSDVAVFSLEYKSLLDRQYLETFTKVIPIAIKRPEIGDKLTIVGFGCEVVNSDLWEVPFWNKCLKSTNFAYIKYANTVVEGKTYPGVSFNDRNFYELATQNDQISGYVGRGDSGGPALNEVGELVGVTSESLGLEGAKVVTIHAWVGYSDVLTFIKDSTIDQSTLFDDSNHQYIFANSDSYIGTWLNGLRSGEGIMRYSDGKTYSGSWAKDVRSGYGEQTWPEVSKYISYKGAWDNDLPNGKGTMVFTSGQVYSGEFKDARFEGKGQLTYANGDIRVGNFVANKREGLFTLVTADGHTWRENFSADVRTSVEEIK